MPGSAEIAGTVTSTVMPNGEEVVEVFPAASVCLAVMVCVAFLTGGNFSLIGTWEEADQSSDPLLADFMAGREESDDGP